MELKDIKAIINESMNWMIKFLEKVRSSLFQH